MGVPMGAFMPDRAFVPGSTSPMHNINTVDLPVNIGIIKCGSEIILADSGWKQTEYHKMTHFEHFTPLPEQLKLLGLDPADVKKIVIGHAHWDHAGQLLGFSECHAVCATRGVARRRMGAELPEPAHQRREQLHLVAAPARRPAALNR